MDEVRTISPEDVACYLGAGGRRTRILLDPETGHPGLELYHVELAQGASSEVHSRPHPEVLIVLDGTAGVKTSDSLHRATAGNVVLIPAGVEHHHRPDTPLRCGRDLRPKGRADNIFQG